MGFGSLRVGLRGTLSLSQGGLESLDAAGLEEPDVLSVFCMPLALQLVLPFFRFLMVGKKGPLTCPSFFLSCSNKFYRVYPVLKPLQNTSVYVCQCLFCLLCCL